MSNVRPQKLASHVRHPVSTTLLIVDVQQGRCEVEHDAFESQQVIARINVVSEKARNAGALVIFFAPPLMSNVRAHTGGCAAPAVSR